MLLKGKYSYLLKTKKTDITFVQETHLNEEESIKLKRDWVDQVYYSTYSSRKRGVIILIRKNLNFQVLKQYVHQEGRWVILNAVMEGQRLTLANLYAPNTSQPEFIHEVCNVIRIIGNVNIITGGDFNQVRDIYLDKSSRPRQINDLSHAAIDVMSREL